MKSAVLFAATPATACREAAGQSSGRQELKRRRQKPAGTTGPVSMISRNENPHVYTDLSGLNAITRKGRENTPEGLKEVAKQFESLFINMVLKSMRDSTRAFAEGNYLNSNEMEFHQQNLDNQ